MHTSTPPVPMETRYHAATQFEAAADKDRAVMEYRAVVDEFGNCDDADARAVAEKARVALERIGSVASPGR